MSELDSLYREVILDHYKNPRGHGVIERADAEAEGQNPLCGDEVSIAVAFEGDTIADVKFQGRGCAISQAATSMLMDMVKGRTAQEVATMSRDELLDEVGIPLTPVRLKCALLGLGVLKLALHKGRGTPLPEEWAGLDDLDVSVRMPRNDGEERRLAAHLLVLGQSEAHGRRAARVSALAEEVGLAPRLGQAFVYLLDALVHLPEDGLVARHALLAGHSKQSRGGRRGRRRPRP